MGTRGVIGFHLNGEDKCSYNHSDSYPSYLGLHVLQFVANLNTLQPENTVDYLRIEAAKLVEVDDSVPPTASQKRKLKQYLDLTVSARSSDDWYCLLRDTLGSPAKMLAAQYFDQHKQFLMDGLFCEYAYIFNLDEGVLEFYTGFHKTTAKARAGRYWGKRDRKSEYGPVALKLVMPISIIRAEDIAGYVKLMESAEKIRGGKYMARTDDGLWLTKEAA